MMESVPIFVGILIGVLVYLCLLNYYDPFYAQVRKILRKKGRKTLFKDTHFETAKEMANQRREKIRAILAETTNIRFLPYEFLETPPGFEAIEPRLLEENEADGIAQMIRFNWQVERDELLLVERVIDAIVYFLRRGPELPFPRGSRRVHYPTVKLEQTKSTHRSDYIFPWRVVIETTEPEYYQEILLQFESWFGIGIVFSPESPAEFAGQCIEGAGIGMVGVAGGILVDQNDDRREYAMTCSHVLSNTCKSLVVKGEPTLSGLQPDAALIGTSSPCFPIPQNSRRQLDFARPTDIDRYILERRTVRKISPSNPGPPGIITSRVALFEVNGVLYRFPHLEVLPKLSHVAGFIVFPIRNRQFSKPGESGSWVIEELISSWIGMVVAGRDFFLMSYLAEATPLVQYFEARLSTFDNSVRLIPMIY